MIVRILVLRTAWHTAGMRKCKNCHEHEKQKEKATQLKKVADAKAAYATVAAKAEQRKRAVEAGAPPHLAAPSRRSLSNLHPRESLAWRILPLGEIVPAFQIDPNDVTEAAGRKHSDLCIRHLGSMEINTVHPTLEATQTKLGTYLEKVVPVHKTEKFAGKDVIRIMLSPLDDITLTPDDKKFCSIPSEATHFCYCYPVTREAIWCVHKRRMFNFRLRHLTVC